MTGMYPGARTTAEMRFAMAERRETGESYMSIARAFGCSASWVYWVCLAMGADTPDRKPHPPIGPMVHTRKGRIVRRFTPEDDDRLLAMEAQGMRLAHIAKALGRQRHTVQARLMALARRDARREAA